MFSRLFFIVCTAWVCGCAKEEKKEEPKEKPKKPTTELVGRIQSRPGGKDFVLLEAYGKWTIEEGTTLYSYGDNGRSAALETSGEKLGQYVAADLKSGQVEIGDPVYFRTIPKEGEGTLTPPKAPSTTPAPSPTPAPMPPLPQDSAPGVIEPVPLPSY